MKSNQYRHSNKVRSNLLLITEKEMNNSKYFFNKESDSQNEIWISIQNETFISSSKSISSEKMREPQVKINIDKKKLSTSIINVKNEELTFQSFKDLNKLAFNLRGVKSKKMTASDILLNSTFDFSVANSSISNSPNESGFILKLIEIE